VVVANSTLSQPQKATRETSLRDRAVAQTLPLQEGAEETSPFGPNLLRAAAKVEGGVGILSDSPPHEAALVQGRPSLPLATQEVETPCIGGRLSEFSEAWPEVCQDPWVLSAVREGYKIALKSPPPLSQNPIAFPSYAPGSDRLGVLHQAVRDMVAKGAIELAPATPGFYSRMFVVAKATGGWRPIIDLSTLNQSVFCPSFQMETPRTILLALKRGQWLTSLDLKDAYFHVPIHPESRHLLRFCFLDKVWQFKALPFGLSTSPRVFTKILKPILAYAHLHGVQLHMYLDDWLLNPGSKRKAEQDTQFLLNLCQKLGWVVNLEKSDLIPCQQTVYLGILIDTMTGLARPSDTRLQKWFNLAKDFMSKPAPPACQWLQILGHLTSLEKLVPYGRTRIRPIQWQLRSHWTQSYHRPTAPVLLDPESRESLTWCMSTINVTKGVPLGTMDIDYDLFTDSSTHGWGAHIEDQVASGIWPPALRACHINTLELRAVWLGLQAFNTTLNNSTVAIMSDNMSTIAYLKNQGGDTFPRYVQNSTAGLPVG
jgi:hypothetical protein